ALRGRRARPRRAPWPGDGFPERSTPCSFGARGDQILHGRAKFSSRGEEEPAGGNQVSIMSSDPNRRRVLQVIGSSAGLVAVGGLTACQQTGSPPTGPVSGGNVSA